MTQPPEDRPPRRFGEVPRGPSSFQRPGEPDQPRFDFERPAERARFDPPAARGEYDPDDEYEDADEYEEYDDAEDPGVPDDLDDRDEGYEDEPFESDPARVGPNPVRPDPPLFAPVVFDEEDRRPFLPRGGQRGGRGGDRGGGRDGGEGDRGGGGRSGRGSSLGGRYESDAGLLRVLALIGVLGVVILALVLPFSPISVIGGDGGSDDPITARVRDELPPLPEGLVALSRLYEITVREGVTGPLSVEVQLTESVQDGANLGYYAWDGSTWSRIGGVQLASGGTSVTGSIPAQSASIAVLRRTSLAHSMAMIVGPGETPDPAGLSSASMVVVMAGTLGDGGTPQVEPAGLRTAQEVAGDRPVYLGVAGDAGAAGVFASPEATTSHVNALVAAARGQDAAGVYVEYAGVTDAAGFTAFVSALADALRGEQRALIVGVPAEGDGYDWPGIIGVADGLWVQAPLNPVDYHAMVGSLLSRRGVSDTSKTSIILDRRSALQGGDGPAEPISLVEGLTIASTVDFNVDAIGPGNPVTLRTAFLGGGADRQLHWSDDARAVTFTFTEDGEDSTVWFQNEYSFGFALLAAQRGGFGGFAVRTAAAGGSHPDIWGPVSQFVEEGTVSLLRPYGPYLTPCWQSPEGTVEGQPDCWTAETDTTAVVWRAPQETGAYTVRLVVSEGSMFVGQEVVLRVGDAPPEDDEETETPAPTSTPEPEETAIPTPEPEDEDEEEEPEETPAPTEEPEETPAPTSTAGPSGPGGND